MTRSLSPTALGRITIDRVLFRLRCYDKYAKIVPHLSIVADQWFWGEIVIQADEDIKNDLKQFD